MAHPDDNSPAAPRDRWLRGLFMFLFLIFFGVAETLLGLLAVLQFLWLVVTGAPNHMLRRFGASLALWMADAARFQACETEEKPFPWKPWPHSG
jgi:hypothetical protein